ncbi:sorting nexin-10B isoform X2 [Heptranchias perlo]|uniref:sorting nexin-10B isoform X2 n=1 Tax=Heptranchias perlo TaxID=212740 RepID=UPI00355971F7
MTGAIQSRHKIRRGQRCGVEIVKQRLGAAAGGGKAIDVDRLLLETMEEMIKDKRKTNSMCFTKKTSCVRRRYREFAWLRQRLQDNAILIDLPEFPPKNPFFSANNAQHVELRRQGLQEFLEKVLQINILLSDSRLHLFLQTQLNPTEIEACVSGQTDYTVADAVHRHATSNRRFPVEEAEKDFKQ